MHPEAMIATFKSLKLFAMAQAVDNLAQQSSPAWTGAESVPDALLKAEVAEREVRSINCQMKAARLPTHRALAGFAFNESAVNEALVHSLHRGDFIDDAHNVVISDVASFGRWNRNCSRVYKAAIEAQFLAAVDSDYCVCIDFLRAVRRVHELTDVGFDHQFPPGLVRRKSCIVAAGACGFASGRRRAALSRRGDGLALRAIGGPR
jgi:hypothetical protein